MKSFSERELGQRLDAFQKAAVKYERALRDNRQPPEAEAEYIARRKELENYLGSFNTVPTNEFLRRYDWLREPTPGCIGPCKGIISQTVTRLDALKKQVEAQSGCSVSV